MGLFDAYLKKVAVEETENQRSLQQLARGKEDDCCLEGGCGKTSLIRSNLHKPGRVIGIDILPDFLRINKDVDAKAVGDLHALPLRGATFDFVFLNDVVEHLREPGRVLTECYRISKPGGKIVFFTRNVWNPFNAVNLVLPIPLRRFVKQYVLKYGLDTFPSFYRCNSGMAIDRTMRKAGYSRVKLFYYHERGRKGSFGRPLFLVYAWLLDIVGLKFLRGYVAACYQRPMN